MTALKDVIDYARRQGLLVVLDGKRNDIGSTAQAYAAAYLGADDESPWAADALTVSPYLVGRQPGAVFCRGPAARRRDLRPGEDVESWRRHVSGSAGRWPAALPARRRSGRELGRAVGGRMRLWDRRRGGRGDVSRSARRTAGAMPHAWLLVPGYGSQGAVPRDVRGAFDEQGLGAIVNNSRAIIFAHERAEYRHFGPARWQDAVAAATREMIDQLRSETSAGKLGGGR